MREVGGACGRRGMVLQGNKLATADLEMEDAATADPGTVNRSE